MRCSSFITTALTCGTALATPHTLASLRTGNSTIAAGCVQNTGARQCVTAGDRTLQCIDYNQVCPVGASSSPYSAADEDANRAACDSKSEGDACTTVWTCCV